MIVQEFVVLGADEVGDFVRRTYESDMASTITALVRIPSWAAWRMVRQERRTLVRIEAPDA